MIPEGLIKTLNKKFKEKTFRYKGPIMMFGADNFAIEFDYTLKIVQQKQMIYVGELRDTLIVDVFIKNYEGMYSNIFKLIYTGDSFRLVLNHKLNELITRLGFREYFSVNINQIHLEEDGL